MLLGSPVCPILVVGVTRQIVNGVGERSTRWVMERKISCVPGSGYVKSWLILAWSARLGGRYYLSNSRAGEGEEKILRWQRCFSSCNHLPA